MSADPIQLPVKHQAVAEIRGPLLARDLATFLRHVPATALVAVRTEPGDQREPHDPGHRTRLTATWEAEPKTNQWREPATGPGKEIRL